jgi:TolB-like protein/Tfp pilus assembly protein PilF
VLDQQAYIAEALSGRYRIERELGRGGMAIVYLARDLRHDRPVAIKVLRAELAHALGPERFLREIETAARLQHPLILPVFDSGATGSHDGRAAQSLWYAMPFIAGESLRGRLRREGQMTVEEAVRIGGEVAQALGYAHAQGVVHRDIKPENILLSDGHAVVADFGLARAVSAAGDERLTETGLSLGTPAYMSPEQAAAEPNLDGRSDLYALGCVLYEMLAGQPPFTGSTAQAILARHAIDPVPRLRTVRATVPVGVEEAISRALNKVPADRFASVADFGKALDHGLHSTGTRRRQWVSPLRAAAAIALVLTLLFGARHYLGGKAGATHAITSLAVLPFGNLTGDTAQRYLAEGLTDQLVTSLAQVGTLRVISLKGHSEAANEKAMRDNRIDATLAGSLQRAGNAVHITVKLVSSSSNQTLWAQGYDGDLSGILNLQAEVARSVAKQLRASMTLQERSGLTAERPAVNPVAYDAYVRGIYFHSKAVVEADFRKAIGFLQQAIETDPTYAAAYAEIASCYADMGYLGLVPPEGAFPQARAAAVRALELDSLLGEAHVAVGAVAFLSGWDFTTAEREIRRGLELNPTYARGYLHYMVLLVALNRSDEAIAVMKRAQEVEPLSFIVLAAAARPYYNARRYDEAIAQSQKALEVDSLFGRAHYWLGLSYEHQSRTADAIRVFEQLSARAPISLHLAALGHAYAVAGQRDKAEQAVRELQARSESTYVSPFDFATLYAGLGDRPRALEWLEKAYQRRAPYILLLAVDPQFDAFRGNPRFRDLVRRIGLAPGS